MAVLDVQWETLERVSPAEGQTTGTPASERTAPQRLDKPVMIWIEDPADAEENDKVLKIAFDPDKVRVGAYYFRRVKMTKDKAAEDPLLAEEGKKFPRLVFLGVDGSVAEVLEGKISSSKIFDAMKSVAKETYEGSFEKNVKDVIKLLGELDKIADERKAIEEKEKKDLKEAEAKKLAKEKQELESREKEVLDQRKELLSPTLRTA